MLMIHPFLQCISFNNTAGETMSFNAGRELEGGFDIMNLVTFENKSYQKVKVGRVDPKAPEGKELILNKDMIVWQHGFNQTIPRSVCNEQCHTGKWKKMKEGEMFCCYDCISCPEGKISNATGVVLGTFVKHRDTPIVKANNRDLTYILLISLLLCFLSPFLFLGQPLKVTCLLQQPTFGIIFSVAVSSVLAKTSIVSLAFVATKPGSRMKKWVGKRLTYSILILCSFMQTNVCVMWLVNSPPFPDIDLHSGTEEIVLRCNEGSAVLFYCVLSYMGLLAITSFIVAFLARKLPDSFNEAKFITFSITSYPLLYRACMKLIPASASRKKLLAWMVTLLKLLLLLFPQLAYKIDPINCLVNDPPHVPHQWYQPGDLHIGGITSLIIHTFHTFSFKEHPSQKFPEVPILVTKFYQHVLALVFAINEINEDPKILPNVTLGYHIYDSYYDASLTYHVTAELLFKSHRFVPNYKCGTQRNLINAIGGLGSDISFHIEDILSVYKIPQIAYGSFAPEESVKTQVSSFYRMVPNEAHQYKGIIHLLKHFGWTWIGFFIVDDDSGDNFLQALESLFSQNGICLAFIQRTPQQVYLNDIYEINSMFLQVYLPFMETSATTIIAYGETLSIMWLNYFLLLGTNRYEEITSVAKVWILTAQTDFAITSLQRASDLHLFQGAISFAIHSSEIPGFKQFLENKRPRWSKADGFQKNFWEQAFDCSFPNPQEPMEAEGMCTGVEKMESLPESVFEMRMTGHSYSIYNAVYVTAHALHAMYTSRANDRRIELQSFHPWKALPLSLCNEHCYAGYQKRKKEGKKFCCYDCSKCPEGKISNSNALVLGIFIKHKSTPIVKASNWDLTYILLISLLLCFLSPLMFIGWPNHVTCLLQQFVFGIIFSVAVSCVLAKTFTVVVAFMATKPGSNMKKWLGKRWANSIVYSGSLIQASNCMVWLATSPPFQDVDMLSLTKEIIVKCNEGSPIMFYLVLGYMGLLAIISFMVAFLARKLPDSFNEAKFITFSMLVFCSVWLSFVPAYLSTNGKYMVVVEIFSILASTGGILGCIFSPKCYIILLRPDLNCREQLTRTKHL
ncbi:Vomeronasal type-2 receptor 26 [Varanus komodoensis]|nr:Vomeronasal type-2 receptor 26 [Varanus komodoensis]